MDQGGEAGRGREQEAGVGAEEEIVVIILFSNISRALILGQMSLHG